VTIVPLSPDIKGRVKRESGRPEKSIQERKEETHSLTLLSPPASKRLERRRSGKAWAGSKKTVVPELSR